MNNAFLSLHIANNYVNIFSSNTWYFNHGFPNVTINFAFYFWRFLWIQCKWQLFDFYSKARFFLTLHTFHTFHINCSSAEHIPDTK